MPRLPKANERRTTRPPKNPKKSAATRAAVTAGVVTFSACIICPWLIPLAMAGGAAYLAYRHCDGPVEPDDSDAEDDDAGPSTEDP